MIMSKSFPTSKHDDPSNPHVNPSILISSPSFKLFKAQQRFMCSKLLGRQAESLRITFAPNLAHKIPGRDVPDLKTG